MKHAAPADQTPAPASSPETTARRRFSAPKIIGIVAGSIVGLLLIAYVAGSLYFTDRFMPNTVLGDHDVSLKTSSEVQAILDDALSDYTVAVSGQGFSMKLSAKDAGVMAASWAQYQAQDALIKTCEKAGIELTLFHGRGGSIGRGGAPACRGQKRPPCGRTTDNAHRPCPGFHRTLC